MNDKCEKCGCDWKAVGTMFKMLETFYEGWKCRNAAPQQNIYALASSSGVWLFSAESDEIAESGVMFGNSHASKGYIGWLLWTEETLAILGALQPKMYASPNVKDIAPTKVPWIKTTAQDVITSIREAGIFERECYK